jgi:hypothetical protein
MTYEPINQKYLTEPGTIGNSPGRLQVGPWAKHAVLTTISHIMR